MGFRVLCCIVGFAVMYCVTVCYYCMQARVTAGTKPELVVLMDIPNVKAHRARLLYAAGLKTVEAVAGSSEATLMSILAKGKLSFHSMP